MKLVELELDSIARAGWNPDPRSDPDYCKDILESMRRVGQIMPALVVPDNGGFTLVDGHRRFCACRILGTKLLARVLPKDADIALLYAEVNTANKRLSSRDRLSVYLSNPAAVDDKTRKECDKWAQGTLAFVSANGGGIATLRQARMVANYADSDADQTARWLSQHNLSYKIRKAIEDGTPPQVISLAISNGKALQHLGWDVAA